MRLPTCAQIALIATFPAMAGGQTLHSFGNPSAHEQEYIEKINRARANPPAEGVRLANTTHPGILAAYAPWDPDTGTGGFGVNLAMFQSEMNAISAKPPLAPQSQLMAAARNHSQWMFDNAVQDHVQTGGLGILQRITGAGYSDPAGYTLAENIFAYSEDPEYGHAGLVVDWGDGGTGGMQNPRGHRDAILSSSYREIGVGVVNGTNTVNGNTVGPQLVTQDFGNRNSARPLGTGVAYYDLDGDNSYDAGEGISGLTVNVSGTTTYCLTADGGGWAIPIPTTATNRTVTFSGLGISQSVIMNVPSNSNAKADLKLAYTPPVFTSPAIAPLGRNHNFSFTPIGGATGYSYTSYPLNTAAAENCENLTNATATTSAGYSVVQSSVKHEGTNAWRMTPSNEANPVDQSIELNPVYVGTATSSITFRSRLGFATTKNFIRVQVKREGTDEWMNLYSQQGTSSAGELVFASRTVSLASMQGKAFRIRFLFDLIFDPSTSRYTQTSAGVGWYIDAINFTNTWQATTSSTGTLSGTSGSLVAPASTPWHLMVRPIVGGYLFPAAEQTLQVVDTNVYANWVAYHEAAGGLAPGALTAGSDPDGDGRRSLLEYAFGSNPVVADAATSTFPVVQPSATHLVLRYGRDTALSGLVITPEASDGSGVWRIPGQPGAPVGFVDVLISTTNGVQTREARIPLSAGGKHFLRLRTSVP